MQDNTRPTAVNVFSSEADTLRLGLCECVCTWCEGISQQFRLTLSAAPAAIRCGRQQFTEYLPKKCLDSVRWVLCSDGPFNDQSGCAACASRCHQVCLADAANMAASNKHTSRVNEFAKNITGCQF